MNYSGDILIYTGIALVGGDLRYLIVPGLMAGIFVGLLIPLKEKYLRDKYGAAFEAYARRSQRLVPYIFLNRLRRHAAGHAALPQEWATPELIAIGFCWHICSIP